ncbi:MAG: hypothetical protein K0Q59_3808 [Paenibacillus sp.]|nr:hypothetical protein [Paenibacillus sp.]
MRKLNTEEKYPVHPAFGKAVLGRNAGKMRKRDQIPVHPDVASSVI